MRHSLKKLVFWTFSALLAGVFPSHAFESTYPAVSAVGDFNGWNTGANNLTLVDYYVWQGDIAIPAGEFEFKFSTPTGFDDGNNWGIGVQPHETLPQAGVAIKEFGNFTVNNTTDSTIIRFTFNDQTHRYSVMAINNLTNNLLHNSSFETPGSEASRARYWQQNNPNVHGGVSGGAERGDWEDPPPFIPDGDWFAAILGNWSGFSSGEWWQEAPVEPGLTYEASAWFYAEGAPNQWSADEQGMRLEFYDFNGDNLLAEETISLMGVTNEWQVQTVSAKAPAKAAWARVVMYAANTGPSGTLLIDDVNLEAVQASRSQDFNDWPGATVDDNYLHGGWLLNTGKTVSVVIEDGITNQLARSGLAASLASAPNATNTGVYGGFVQSPRLDGGLGTISFYYRHGFIGDPEIGPEEPISLRVQISEFGLLDWQTVSTIDNIFTIDHVRHDVPLLDYDSRYVRIQHAGGSTNRLIIDDIDIAFPEPLSVTRFMNFDNWPPSGETLGCDTFQGWTICTGLVSAAFAKSGLSAQIFGAEEDDPNYLQSPFFENGYGPISFSYRRGTNGLGTVGLAIEASPDGDVWTELDRIEGIFETSWQDYSRFFFNEDAHYIRIRNLFEGTEAEGGAVLISEPFDGGSQAPPGWTFNRIGQYNSDASSGESGPPSLRFDRDQGDSYVITPDVVNPTNIQFMIRGNGTGGDSTFHVRGWEDGQWVTIEDITSFSGAFGGEIRSFEVSTNMTRFQFQYTKDLGNVAFDDLLITGLPPEDENLVQILMLDDVNVANPSEFRTQDFESWPTKNTYAGDSTHQFWRLENDNIVNSDNAFEGQVARLRRPSGGPDPTITSHFFTDGIGSIDFVYRAWPNDDNVGMRVQVSEDGESWTTLETVTGIQNTHYTNFSLFVGDPDAHYMRIVQHDGNANTRLMVDNISVPKPQPPPNVLVTGWHEPERPFSDEEVTLYANTIAQNGATDLALTGYYRTDTNGSFTALPMTLQDGSYRTTDTIPPQPTGTLVEYYIEVEFSGPGGQGGTVFYPEDGATDPASYQIPRVRPGSVWINEIDYIAFAGEGGIFDGVNKDFIELAGAENSDISDWRIEIIDGTAPEEPIGVYPFGEGTVLSNWGGTGFGFFVLGGQDIPVPPRDMLLTNTLFDIAGGGGIRLINELDQVEQALSFGGLVRGFDFIGVHDQDDPVGDWEAEHTNSVGLVGTGIQADHFEWAEFSPPTPGEPNANQFFGDPASILPSEELLAFTYIAGSFPPEPKSVVITNDGAADLTYTITPQAGWLSVEPGGGTNVPAGGSVTHTVSVDTTGLLGNPSSSLSVEGGAPNSPQSIIVTLTQVSPQTGLLSYNFDQGSGGTALNAGSVGGAGNLALAGGARWTFSGGGVSGAAGDFAIRFDGEDERLRTSSAIPELNDQNQFTILGWLRTTEEGDDHRLVGNRMADQGFDLMLTSNYTQFAFVTSAGGDPEPVLSDPGVFNTNDWVFFAVTYDSEDTGGEAVKFYTGSLSNDVALLSAHPKDALGTTGGSTNRFHVGGDGVTAFDGLLDEIRVFTNVADIMTLQGIRNISVDRQTGEGEAPQILIQPQDQTVNIDAPVQFEVTASGDPEPTYQWRFNGTNISLIDNDTAQNEALFIGNAQPGQMGEYTVVVQNQFGIQTSEVANLFVNHPPSITQQPQDRDVYIGMNASLSAAVDGYPEPERQWWKDGEPVGGAVALTYPIPNADMHHNGEYYLVVSNFMGTAQSDTATVRVLDPDDLAFDGDDSFRPAPGGGMVLQWETANGRVFDIYWSTNLMEGVEGFTPIATGLPATPPMNVYTDDVHGVERSGFYRIELREP